MSPDINTLHHASRTSTSGSPLANGGRRISLAGTEAMVTQPGPPSPRSPSLSSLQAAATINAGLHRGAPESASPVRGTIERRRSSLMNNFFLNDPAMPSPGEMQQSTNAHSPHHGRRRSSVLAGTADPHHHRQPSLGELHQELEAETEGQVNRLLHMIRLQQDQLNTLQGQGQGNPQDSSAIAPTPPATSRPTSAHPHDQPTSRSGSFSSAVPHVQTGLPHGHGIFNRPHSLSRQSSARISNTDSNSHATSPALRPSSGSLGPLTEDFLLGGTREDAAFYQAETQMLTRENQMLKFRIRELERQIADSSPSTQQHNQSINHSPLAEVPSSFANEAVAARAPAVQKTA
ncbi:hypothetical protein Q7P35_003386 [Cladosporium inversicolor]